MNFFLQAFLKYLEAHPDQVEKLIAALIEAVVSHLQAPKTPSA